MRSSRTQRPPRQRRRHSAPPEPHGCRCRPNTGWPVLHAHHLGNGHWRYTRRHDGATCGLPAEPTILEPNR